jgi:malonyl-CoA O-methyltransferase
MSVRGVFVTGTDTDIGKTLVAACLVRRWGADYWKPAQTGLIQDAGDSRTIAWLAGADPARIHPPRHALQQPLSPEAAATAEGASIKLDDFILPHTTAPLVVEGAGGVLVPLADGVLMIDLIRRFGLPAVLVARGTLGTINHTLLSVEALRSRNIPVFGVVLVGLVVPSNREAIERHGKVKVLAEIPPLGAVNPATVAETSKLFAALP